MILKENPLQNSLFAFASTSNFSGDDVATPITTPNSSSRTRTMWKYTSTVFVCTASTETTNDDWTGKKYSRLKRTKYEEDKNERNKNVETIFEATTSNRNIKRWYFIVLVLSFIHVLATFDCMSFSACFVFGFSLFSRLNDIVVSLHGILIRWKYSNLDEFGCYFVSRAKVLPKPERNVKKKIAKNWNDKCTRNKNERGIEWCKMSESVYMCFHPFLYNLCGRFVRLFYFFDNQDYFQKSTPKTHVLNSSTKYFLYWNLYFSVEAF